MTGKAAGALRWLYVDLNSFFASVEQQEDSRLLGRPVIVTPVESDYTAAIAVSYEAKARGVRNGMGVREARDICPDLTVRVARHDVYVRYSQQITREVERHLPVDRICSIDEMACRLTGQDAEMHMATQLGRAIQQALITRIGPAIRCSIGVAPSRLLAKLACDMQKPLGLTILPADRLPEAILHLALGDIPGVGQRMQKRLAAVGIDTLRAFWDVSPSRARAIWGSIEGENVWYGLHGVDPVEPPQTERQSIGHSAILPQNHRHIAGARLAARELLMRGAARLRRMNHYARSLGVSCLLLEGGMYGREARFAPLSDSLSLLARFDALWTVLEPEIGRRPVKRVGIMLTRLLGPDSAQPDLFAPAVDATLRRSEALSSALDTINLRYGRNTLHIGEVSQALSQYSGAKIAFNRIPDADDFR